jgi:hypothetical protein
LTFYYHGGQDKYQVEQTLTPDEQMWLDLGQLIRDQVPGKDGKTIPPEVTSGVYEIQDLSHVVLGPLYEAKLIVDKTNGHAFYGCYYCCGADALQMGTNPLNLLPAYSTPQTVWSANTCQGSYINVTDAMTFWDTDDHAIATASNALVYGVAVGSTEDLASGLVAESGWHQCPQTEESAHAPADVTVAIKFQDQPVNGKTQSVVVGQQIALTASYALPPGVTVTSRSWSVAGTTVGGFNTGNTDGGPIATNFTQDSTTFYWVTSGNSLNVTFTLNLSNSTKATATTTFNVAGPTAPNMQTTLGTINISNNTLVFGGSGSNIGIKFTPSATAPSGYSNTWVYVQVIDSLTISLTGNPGHRCTGSGLDNAYPYPHPPVTSTYTDDNPAIGLNTAYTEETDNMAAHMWVMWSSGLSNSVPVPLGYVSWQWFGDATYSGGAWVVQPSSSRSANSFQASSSYPTWTTYYPAGSTCP